MTRPLDGITVVTLEHAVGLRSWLELETRRYAPMIKAAGQFAD